MNLIWTNTGYIGQENCIKLILTDQVETHQSNGLHNQGTVAMIKDFDPAG